MSETESVDPTQGNGADVAATAGEAKPDEASAAQPGETRQVYVEELIDVPVVEILPPEAEAFDPRQPNVTVDRTNFSVGLSGLSLNRTRMSTDSGQQQGKAVAPGDDWSKRAGSAPADAVPSQSDPAGTTSESDIPSFENAQLFTRFLMGLVAFSLDEVMERLQKYDAEIAAHPEDYDLTDHLLERLDATEDSVETLFRYWAIGAVLWSERSVLQLTYRGFQASIGVSHSVLHNANRASDNMLMRPIRRPIDRVIGSLTAGAQARIAEGRSVEGRDRMLAELTVNDLVSGVIDYVSDNPQLADLISQQGLGMASTIMDNGRQVGAKTDSAAENLVRKIFRRKPRAELPPSPFVGKPQDMYDPQSADYEAKKNKDEK